MSKDDKMNFDQQRICTVNNAILTMSEVKKAVKLLFDAGGQRSYSFRSFIDNGPAASHNLYRNLVREEYKELMTAYESKDPVEILDGICDLIWVAVGMAIAMELPIEDAWQEVVRSNLQKIGLDGSVVKDENGKIQKPLGWTPPQIANILEKF